ncbi:FixH family protein [Virgibacillus sp. LDC1]|uniref:FixH family protein n=1 Tax=Paenibacillus sp. 843 TaxID=3341795 RepID=UPI0037273CF0|nr:FixH family protein [Virgibacillus sp. LDC1]
MIIKSRVILSVLLSVLLLSACSANPGAADRYEKEIPLIAEVNIPETLSVHQPETIEIILTQAGQRVPGADFVHYELWSHDGSLRDPMTDAVEVGDGVYTVTKTFDKEGLYFIKLHSGNNGSIIIPQKPFAVGKLSEAELAYLQAGTPTFQEGTAEHHH